MTEAINKAELVCPIKLDTYSVVLVSISGGSDSDIVMDLVERHKGTAKVIYVWFDTGLEYDATKRHLLYLEERYGVKIETMKAVIPIPTSCATKGVPFLSKEASDMIYRLQKHGFKWEDKPFEVLFAEYPKCKSALRWWCNKRDDGGGISRLAYLKEYMIENPPNFKISPYCCMGAKKLPAARAIKKYNAVLDITGERRAEGGLRAVLYDSCFSPATDDNIARYRPIFFFTDIDKTRYELVYKIVHSDCYTIYGMKRTGCAACPLGSRFEDELKVIEQYEPKLFRAANAIFEKSYEYTRKYREFKLQMKEVKKYKNRERKSIKAKLLTT
jgi:3'-phosphoadenosine 5'-phosphosulfate sulfotransferase (PAPS reductase)/FAD synthetase